MQYIDSLEFTELITNFNLSQHDHNLELNTECSTSNSLHESESWDSREMYVPDIEDMPHIPEIKTPDIHEHIPLCHTTIKRIGSYTIAERKLKIQRYRRKRNWEKIKKVVYPVRKALADSRPRKGGKFLKVSK
tara:strand:+ start:4058 stop:4456 length:399 start_codon:yes stop_codon:yes gene_type:complete